VFPPLLGAADGGGHYKVCWAASLLRFQSFFFSFQYFNCMYRYFRISSTHMGDVSIGSTGANYMSIFSNFIDTCRPYVD
jgi:hypothetical protein